MTITLFDPKETWLNLLPLTFTRPISQIRVGILTIAEKWQKLFDAGLSYSTECYLQDLFPYNEAGKLLIRSNILPTKDLVKAISSLKPNEALVDPSGLLLACVNTDGQQKSEAELASFRWTNQEAFGGELERIERVYDIFSSNEREILKDFRLLTANRKSAPITDPFTRLYNEQLIFAEEAVTLKSGIVNAENGPIYIGKNVKIQEGAILQGPLAICEHTIVNIGAKLRKNTTIGPYSKVGGEISNSVIFGYSNKAHDGFLGNSVIGEWCNLGAATNNSNMKNNYGEIKIWNYQAENFIHTGLNFCGLMMGDHSKCAINTMFNTGSVVGVGANIFGTGFPRAFLPSFSWGGTAGFKTYEFEKAIEAESIMMKRRGLELNVDRKKMLKHIFDFTAKYRMREND